MALHTLLSPGGATEAKQDDILDALAALLIELNAKFEEGEEVALSAATLAALETVTAVVSGSVALDAPTLAALESITATIANFPVDYPDAAALAELQAILAELQSGLTITNFPASVEVSNDTGNPIPVSGTVSVNEPVTVDGTQLDALTEPEMQGIVDGGLDSGEREYLHVTATVTNSGDTTILTPASGNAIRLHWVYAVSLPGGSNPIITVKLGSSEKYRVYAVSKRQLVTGAIDAPLVVNLSTGGTVAFTAIYEEI